MSDKIKRGVAFPKQVFKAVEDQANKSGITFGSQVVQDLQKTYNLKESK